MQVGQQVAIACSKSSPCPSRVSDLIPAERRMRLTGWLRLFCPSGSQTVVLRTTWLLLSVLALNIGRWSLESSSTTREALCCDDLCNISLPFRAASLQVASTIYVLAHREGQIFFEKYHMPAQGCQLPISSYCTEVFKRRQSGVYGGQLWGVDCPSKEGLHIDPINDHRAVIDSVCDVPSRHGEQP